MRQETEGCEDGDAKGGRVERGSGGKFEEGNGRDEERLPELQRRGESKHGERGTAPLCSSSVD